MYTYFFEYVDFMGILDAFNLFPACVLYKYCLFLKKMSIVFIYFSHI